MSSLSLFTFLIKGIFLFVVGFKFTCLLKKKNFNFNFLDFFLCVALHQFGRFGLVWFSFPYQNRSSEKLAADYWS